MISSTKYVLLRATVIEMHHNELDQENCCTESTWTIVGAGMSKTEDGNGEEYWEQREKPSE